MSVCSPIIKLKVQPVQLPEGVPRASSIASIADLSGNGTWTKSVDIDFPSETVNGSEKLEVSASGNFLASVFDNLEDLMKRPYGCGEQNMLNFAPNIFLLEFYLRTDTLTNALKTKAVTYMLAGYQKENKYRHKDGGFSAFGSRDPQASTWLTAFVVKCYALAQQLYLQNDDLLAIDSNIMEESLKFLTVRQKRDGSFYENGTVFHKEMQGASAEEGVSLTAYTLIAMYEAQQVFREGNDTLSMKILDHIESSMDRATAYLTTKLSTLTDSYDICVTTYALTLVDAPAKETAFIMMQNKAIVNAHGKHWERPKPQKEERYHWSATTDSINIEMTAYALLVYSLRPDAVSNGFPVLKWLTKNKGPNAGFYSTQDTIIGLQALSRVGSELYTGEDIPMNVTITYVDPNGMDEMHVFDLDKSNEMLLQIARINYMNNNPKVLDIKVQTRSGEKGPTNAVVETTLRYNIMEKVRTNRYILDFTQTQTKARFILDISIKAPHGEKRSMSILAVELAAGYFPDLESLGDNIFISLAEVREDTLYVYFDTDVIDSEGVEVRAIFQVKPSGALTKPKPRFIRVYDFYEPQYEASQTYTLKQVGDDEFCSNVGDVGVCAILHSQSTMN
ncbi:hypothetical protein RRG08_025322 [Elysia crispata]|uniref:Alpha-macroglobulin receptor-binding domain-containing protein n=1 Tax=Elysia crispata TaxID=231223 RepID=A0AAE1A9A1_9GAST|nr:hypothetical protein RRG08_025322 [Elysia crispata]